MAGFDVPGGARKRLLESYRGYLIGERGLAVRTADNYVQVAGVFLAEVPTPFTEALRNLSAGQVLEIVGDQGRLEGPSARSMVNAVRVLLRYLFAGGWVDMPLASVVPRAARWRLALMPARFDAGEVAALLDGCDRSCEPGRRNSAVIMLLARLGLRAGEAAGLTLDDVNWRAGTITIRGKGGRCDQLPLPNDVGEALAEYLRARPSGCASRALFLSVYPPFRAIGRNAVAGLVRRACVKAGIGQAGPHRLRHGLATDLLGAGASLAEVGQVLRHHNLQTTAIYAKVDRRALAALARPWPVEEPGATS